MNGLLNQINSPIDLKKITEAKLPQLAEEIRQEIIKTISQTGGHLAPSLGVVELTIALHYVLNAPEDKIIWDVGHQSYAHKLLTGRREKFSTLRQLGGLSGFPNKDESIYDTFTVGHASTSISSALGLAAGRDLQGKNFKVMAVIGDAALGGGMAFEALNHAGHLGKNMIVVLNDNAHSISRTVGALSGYLNRIMTAPIYNRVRKDVETILRRVPRLGFRMIRAARKLEEGLKSLLVPGIVFEEMGFRYFGPVDGHNIALIIKTLKNIVNLEGPLLIHLITKKGKGCAFAEECPDKFHGIGPFDAETGKKLESLNGDLELVSETSAASFTEAFSRKLIKLAEGDEKIVAITAAMPEGTGLDKFAAKFPQRFFDAGIAEGHALTFAAGLARSGLKPVVVIYSTFLQRSYDQIVHDLALQNLPVVLAIDRAGLVGEDGATHQGSFDMAYLHHIPHLTILAPKDILELEQMLEFAVDFDKPIAIRYPKGKFPLVPTGKQIEKIALGKAEILKKGTDLAIIAIGSMVSAALETSKLLEKENINSWVINSRFVKPLDKELFKNLSTQVKKIITIEEGVLEGGFGSAVLELLEELGIKNIEVKRFGLPDEFIEHGKREELLKKYNLTPEAIADYIKKSHQLSAVI